MDNLDDQFQGIIDANLDMEMEERLNDRIAALKVWKQQCIDRGQEPSLHNFIRASLSGNPDRTAAVAVACAALWRLSNG